MEQEKNVNAIVEHIVSEANKDAANVYGDALTTTLGKAELILRGIL